MVLKLIALLLLSTTAVIYALDNGLARTPPMGWLQWERYRCITDCETYPNDCVSEGLFKRTADLMASEGYLKAGYNYVNIDDCWAEHARTADGTLVADKKRFPNGIKSLADHVHSKDLKLGIYTDFGTLTCGGYPGSIFHMEKDSQTFADWGIDMLKVDGCYSCNSLMPKGYETFGFWLNKTERPILYSCSWPAYIPKDKPYKDIAKLCNIWRNYGDIQDTWSSVLNIINYNGDHQDEITPFVENGAFNDLDMLLIGDYGLSKDESQTQFALWSILAAPLFMSADLAAMEDWQKEILLNSEIIAVSQDSLGKMGRRVYSANNQQNWVRELADGSKAVAIMSTREDIPIFMSISFDQLKVTTPMHVRDLYQHKDLGVFNGTFKAMVNPSGVAMLKFTKA